MAEQRETAGEPICRICHELTGELIRPCECRGTVQYVHSVCIQRWLRQQQQWRSSDSLRCEICGARFSYRVHIRSIACFFVQSWRRLVHIAYIAFIARRFLAQIDVLTSIIVAGPRRRKAFASSVVLHGFMLAHYTIFLAFDLRILVRQWLRWRSLTSAIVVFDKTH